MRPQALTIALDPVTAPCLPEVQYVLRTLLSIAGFGAQFTWASREAARPDIYYGPDPTFPATVSIRSDDVASFVSTGAPDAVFENADLLFLAFGAGHREALRRNDDSLTFSNDIVRATFWLLTGAGEGRLRRDRRDNFDLSDAFVWRNGLMRRPVVSEYGAHLRWFFAGRGRLPLDLPWTGHGAKAAFAFSHDVDYPEIIRGIEAVRLLRVRGFRGFRSVVGVLSGTNHFWKFRDWVDWQKGLGTRPAFYFSVVQGSLIRFALGTPDCFYDVRRPAFRDLFQYLRDEGCEIGLHASYHSHASAASLAAERLALQSASESRCEGLRHHYWRLRPDSPHETLSFHERAGFTYDSSLGFEFGPGFRRSVCHPFHAYLREERRELSILQIPPAWMDDHFDRRLAWNGISSPDDAAAELLAVARKTRGVAVVDYHARGMNAEFFPRYGPWLTKFVERESASDLQFTRPIDIANAYLEYEARLRSVSSDACTDGPSSGGTVVQPRRRPPRIAVITKAGSRYGLTLLQALAARGVSVSLLVVVEFKLPQRFRILRRLAGRIGWPDALVHAMTELRRPSGPSEASIRAISYAGLAETIERVPSLRALSASGRLREHDIDVILLGQSGIVPQSILEIPSLGTLNAHPGTLPQYRGMDSAAWAVHSGDYSGVGSTLHWVDAGVDTGPLVRRLPYRWRGDETLSLLQTRLYDDCIRLLVDATFDLHRTELPAEMNSGGASYRVMPRSQRHVVESRLQSRRLAARTFDGATAGSPSQTK
jgi:hypothetical protein